MGDHPGRLGLERLAHTPRVSLVACDRRGRSAQGVVAVEALATVVDDDASRSRVHAALLAKHGNAVRVVDALSVLAGLRARLLRRPAQRRVSVRLDPTARERHRVRSPRTAGTVEAWLTI